MPEWLRAVLGSSAFIAGAALAWRAVVVSLAARSKAATERMEAETKRLEAETARMLADIRLRELQAKITEEDATTLRAALLTTIEDLRAARERCDHVLQALEEERIGRAKAEEQAALVLRDFAAYHVEVRAGRIPKITPHSIARVDPGVPR